MISEIFRTYVAGLLSPTSLLGVLLITGVFLLWLKKLRSGKILLTLAALMYLVMSTGTLRYALFSVVETPPQPKPNEYQFVVVLGGKIFPNDKHPTSSQITASLLSRLSYGVALVKARPGSKLIVTGNGAGESRALTNLAKEISDICHPINHTTIIITTN